MLMWMMLERAEIESITGHCLIVLRGDVQEKTRIQVHYSRWAKKEGPRAKNKVHTSSSTKLTKLKKVSKRYNVQPVRKY